MACSSIRTTVLSRGMIIQFYKGGPWCDTSIDCSVSRDVAILLIISVFGDFYEKRIFLELVRISVDPNSEY